MPAVSPYFNWANSTQPEFVGGLTQIDNPLSPPPEYTLSPMLDVLRLPSDDIWRKISTDYFDEYLRNVYSDPKFYDGIVNCPVTLQQFDNPHQPYSRELRAHDTFLNLSALIDRDVETLREANSLLIPEFSDDLVASCISSLESAWSRLNPNPAQPSFPNLHTSDIVNIVLDYIYSFSTPSYRNSPQNTSFNKFVKLNPETILGDPSVDDTTANILNYINFQMVTKRLWDNDSSSPDRADITGNPLNLSAMSPDMRKNYAIIYLAVLHGVIKHKLENPGVKLLENTWDRILNRPVSPNFLSAINYSNLTRRRFEGDPIHLFNVNLYPNSSLPEFSRRLHTDIANGTNLWGNDHKGIYTSQDFDHRRNLALIAFCDLIGSHLNSRGLSSSLKLSFETNPLSESSFNIAKLLESKDRGHLSDSFWNLYNKLTGNYDKQNVSRTFLDNVTRGDDIYSADPSLLFYSAKCALVHGWTSVFRDGYFDDKDYHNLKWDVTATAATLAIFDTINTFNDLNDPDYLRKICYKTHRLMVGNNLWGSDSRNRDRYDSSKGGRPRFWDELSDDYKANINLIVLATIAGITNSMKNHAQLLSRAA